MLDASLKKHNTNSIEEIIPRPRGYAIFKEIDTKYTITAAYTPFVCIATHHTFEGIICRLGFVDWCY